MRTTLFIALAIVAIALAACHQPTVPAAQNTTGESPAPSGSSGSANASNDSGQTLPSSASFCGDGAVQGPDSRGVAEQCDAGSRNGQACEAPYGGSCTYCTSACTIATVNGGYCGDGVCQSYESNAQCPADCKRSFTGSNAPGLVYYHAEAVLNGSGIVTNATPNVNSTFTIALWVDQENRTSDAYLVSRDAVNTTTWDGYALAIGNAGFVEYKTVGRSRATSSIGDVAVGNWTHIAVTYNRSAIPQLTFYVNGKPVRVQNGIDPPKTLSTPLLIGRRGAEPVYGLVGTIEDLRIYDTVLNATQIGVLVDAHP